MIVEEEEEVALPLKISDFCLQAQKSLNFEPSGVQQQQQQQKTMIELDASQLERHSALYNLEHSSDLPLEHIFSHSHSPPIQQPENKKTEMIDRQLLSNLFKRKPRRPTGHHPQASSSKSKRKNFCNPSKMLKRLGLERLAIFQPRSGRDDDLDDIIVTSPAAAAVVVIAPQDDPRSPINPSTIDRVSFFKSFRGAFS